VIYVLHTMSGSENEVVRDLQRSRYNAIVLRENTTIRRGGSWKQETRYLLPGYVFLILPSSILTWQYSEIKRIHGIIRFLGTGYPVPLPEEEEAWVRWLSNDGCDRPIEESKVEVGEQIRVLGGPLYGREGQIVKIDSRRHRVKVKITTLGIMHEISLSAELVTSLT